MKLLSDIIDNVLKSSGALAEINPGVRTELESAIAACKAGWRHGPTSKEAEDLLTKAVADVWACCAKCESPIEKLLVPWLIFQDYQLTNEYSPAALVVQDPAPAATYLLEPQVSLGGSRFDFLLVFRTSRSGVMVAIECDGKAFHDNVKDFYRDRSWRLAGLPTVRLSGSEIHASPQRAALKVARALHDEADKAGLL